MHWSYVWSVCCLVFLVFVLTNLLIVLVFVTSNSVASLWCLWCDIYVYYLSLWSLWSCTCLGLFLSPWWQHLSLASLWWSPEAINPCVVPSAGSLQLRLRQRPRNNSKRSGVRFILFPIIIILPAAKKSFILVWRQTMKKEKSLSLAEMEHIHFCLMRQKYLGWLLERSHSKRALMV